MPITKAVASGIVKGPHSVCMSLGRIRFSCCWTWRDMMVLVFLI